MIVHDWFGELRPAGGGSPSVFASFALSRPVQDAEYSLDLAPGETEAVTQARVDASAARVRRALERLPAIRVEAVAAAPADWLAYVTAESGTPPVDRLYFEGLELDLDDRLAVVFTDEENIYVTVVARLDAGQRVEHVGIREG